MSNPALLFFNNVSISGGTLASSGDASGFPKENLKDWRQATPYRWKGTTSGAGQWVSVDCGQTRAADTAVIAGHNVFSTGARWKIQFSSDNVNWNDAFSSQTPSNNLPQMMQWGSVSRQYWRVYIDKSGGGALSSEIQLGVLTIGPRLDFEAGALPELDPYGETTQTEWTNNEGGTFLGANLRYVRKRFTFNYDKPGMTASGFFAKASPNFDGGFIPHARSNPFWFAWNYSVDPGEVYLSRVNGGISMPFVGSTARRSLKMSFDAYKEL
jgi:hypothetical protein